MAIYHFSHHFLRRNTGTTKRTSSVSKAAYNAGQKLEDNKGSTEFSDYTRKGGVLFDEICLPSGSPKWADDRGELWRRLEVREDKSTRCKDAVLAHNFDVALPHELTLEQNIFLARDFVREQFARKGYAADWAIHSADPRGDSRNIHLHILVPWRKIKDESFGNKLRYGKGELSAQQKAWRKSWSNLTNRHLKRYGHQIQIDERTLKAQGSKRTPTRHHGVRAKTTQSKLDVIRLPQPRSPMVRITKQTNLDGSVKMQMVIRHSALNHIGHAPMPNYAVKLMPLRKDAPHNGWPPEAISMWRAWGQRDPVRFFTMWRELASPNFDFAGGHEP